MHPRDLCTHIPELPAPPSRGGNAEKGPGEQLCLLGYVLASWHLPGLLVSLGCGLMKQLAKHSPRVAV